MFDEHFVEQAVAEYAKVCGVAPIAIAKEHLDLKIGGEYGSHHRTSGPTKEYK